MSAPRARTRAAGTPAARDSNSLTQRARETRAKVLDAAADCLRELGPLGATSNEIARRAGVSWGVIQYHFGTRAGILLALIEDGFGSLLDTLDASIAPQADAATRIRTVVDAVWEHCTKPDYLLYTDIIRLLRHDADSAARVDALLQRSEEELATRMSRLLGSPAARSSTSTRTMQRLIFATMRGLAIRQSFVDADDDYRRERELLTRSLTLAVERPPRSRA